MAFVYFVDNFLCELGGWLLLLETFAFELFFEVVERQAECGGSAVGAVAAAIEHFAPCQQRFDFLAGEGIAGFDGGFAGHHV